MNNNLISVIVPVYNLENYIERCLASIQSQTYSNIEIIVVDDGSIDSSWNIINRIAKEDNRIIPIHKENGGVSSARMLGLANANGEWIGFVDGDDEIEEDMYEVLINNAFEYDADISHCGYKMIFNDGRITSFYDTKVKKIQDNTTGIIDLLEGDLIEPGLCNKLYKKSLFEDIELDTNIKINEDLLLNYYLFKNSFEYPQTTG
ncbi:glycosyltransferase family 2 protein [Catenibacterium mitsuokai]|uniref:glycosyltransferase family 2 protein n=1 Tax=Catenibacterium mitsuokai TaxID=100886 RepID=UPI0011C83928|nr:glycosyltransferase [Catenibacterium mitsuokai]